MSQVTRKTTSLITKRSTVGLLLGAAICPLTAARSATAQEHGDPLGSPCLPPVLYASQPSDAVIGALHAEIDRERSFQTAYYAGAQIFLAKLATAAARLSDALELRPTQQPEILLATSRAWRTIDRRFSDSKKETIFLSKDDTLPNGSAAPAENMLFAILAHEFGHAYQFARQFDHADNSMIGPSGLTRPIRQIELHADFMAGFSLARSEQKYGKPDDLLRRFSDTILNLGDYNFAPCLHHGTPAERYTMMMKGYIEAQRDTGTTAKAASDVGIDLLSKKIFDESSHSQEGNTCNF